MRLLYRTFFKTWGRSLCTDMKGCLYYIIELKNNKIQTLVYHIVSVVYGCIVNHSKVWVGLSKNSLSLPYVPLAGLTHVSEASAGMSGTSPSLFLFSHPQGGESRMLSWQQHSKRVGAAKGNLVAWLRTLTASFPPVSIGQSKFQGQTRIKEWRERLHLFMGVAVSKASSKCPSTILTSWDPCLWVAPPLLNLDCLWDQQNVWVCVGVWRQRLAHTRSCTFHLALLVLSLWGKSDAISWGNPGSLWRGPHR